MVVQGKAVFSYERGTPVHLGPYIQGYLPHKNLPAPPPGPYSSRMPRALWWSYGGGGVAYQRGTPVHRKEALSWDLTGGP